MVELFCFAVGLIILVCVRKSTMHMLKTCENVENLLEGRLATYDLKLKQIDDKLMMLNEQCSEIYNEI